jgi:hypothetical protein
MEKAPAGMAGAFLSTEERLRLFGAREGGE